MPDVSLDPYRYRIDQVLDYVNDHLAEGELDLSTLAGVSHFSPYHFHRIFSTLTGETPQDYILRLRLERAANLLLKSPAYNVTAVAMACGFSSPSVFARAFKQAFGVSARAYQKQRNGTDGAGRAPALTAGGAPLPGTPAIDVRVEVKPALHLAYCANLKGYSLEQICAAWAKIYIWAGAQGLLTPQTVALGISFDDPLITPPAKCRYYACLSVPPEVHADRVVSTLDLPAQRCAVAHAVCVAEEIQPVYRYLYGTWFPASGFQPANHPCFEIYRQTPETHPQGKYDLEVCIPIVPL